VRYVSIRYTPVRCTPIRYTLVKYTFIRCTPIRYTLIKYTPIKYTPTRYTPMRYTPIKYTPVKYTLIRYTSIRYISIRYTLIRYTPIKYTPIRYTPVKYTPIRYIFIRYTPIKCTPVRYTPIKYTRKYTLIRYISIKYIPIICTPMRYTLIRYILITYTPAYKVYPYEMHVRKMYAHNMHACEVQRHAYKIHAREMHAREVYAIRYMPVRYMPMRHPPIRCTLVGYMPVRYVLIFENSFVVLEIFVLALASLLPTVVSRNLKRGPLAPGGWHFWKRGLHCIGVWPATDYIRRSLFIYISATGKPDLSEAGELHPDLVTLVRAETAKNVEHPGESRIANGRFQLRWLMISHKIHLLFPNLCFSHPRLNLLSSTWRLSSMDEPSPLRFPRRVVLLFKMDETDQDIVHAFLRYSGRPESEYLTRRHAVHLDPGRHEHEPDTYLAHLVIDMDANDLQDPDLASLAHEI
jgi:hypothetical protein